MVIYEFIYRSSPDDWSIDFFKNNSKKARRYFFNEVLKDAQQALSDYLASCKGSNEQVLQSLIDMYQEDIDNLLNMKAAFIESGKSEAGSYASLCVAERTVKDM